MSVVPGVMAGKVAPGATGGRRLSIAPGMMSPTTPINAKEQQRRITLLTDANVPLLRELNAEELRKVVKEARVDIYRPGTVIISNGVHVGHSPGERVTPIYIVDKGNPMAFMEGMGRVAQYERGDYFGEMSAINTGLQRKRQASDTPPPASSTSSTVAVSDTGSEVTCLVVETATIERIMDKMYTEAELDQLQKEITAAYSHATVMKRDAGLRQVTPNSLTSPCPHSNTQWRSMCDCF